ncbi:MAG: SGNH/GDSL hydrolase family protein [Acidobacteriota bacterium]|nr:SGNH/GDSL hydrolase family protein [Acidobacteriota bacterium]
MVTGGKHAGVLTILLAMSLCVACQSNSSNGKVGMNQQTSESMPVTPISGPVNYVALGDSTGVGVGARNGGYVARLFKNIVAERPGSNLTNLCVSGATTADVLRSQLRRGIAANPNLVTLGIGINDIGHGIAVEEFARNYEEILSELRKGTSARIVVTNIPDISSAPRIPEFARREYQQAIIVFNERLEAIAARYEVTLFDVHSTTRDQLPSRPEFFSSDGFHPSDAGYELWAREMWPVITRVIGLTKN